MMGKGEWAIVAVAVGISGGIALFELRPRPPCGWGERQHCHIDSLSGVAPRPGEPSQTRLHCLCWSRFSNPPEESQPP